MNKYIELSVRNPQSAKVLVKIDAIRDMVDTPTGTCINGALYVKENYEDIKKIMFSDERRAYYSEGVDFRLKHILQEGIWSLRKEFGDEKTVEYMKSILHCIDETEIHQVKMEFLEEHLEKIK